MTPKMPVFLFRHRLPRNYPCDAWQTAYEFPNGVYAVRSRLDDGAWEVESSRPQGRIRLRYLDTRRAANKYLRALSRGTVPTGGSSTPPGRSKT